MANKKPDNPELTEKFGDADTGWALSPYRRFVADIALEEDDEDGEGAADLKPDSEKEFAQRKLCREGEASIATHVREARDPSETPDEDFGAGMGQGLMAHPLLADLPLGTEAPMERINAMDNDVAKIELKRKLENKLRQQHSSSPTPRAY